MRIYPPDWDSFYLSMATLEPGESLAIEIAGNEALSAKDRARRFITWIKRRRSRELERDIKEAMAFGDASGFQPEDLDPRLGQYFTVSPFSPHTCIVTVFRPKLGKVIKKTKDGKTQTIFEGEEVKKT